MPSRSCAGSSLRVVRIAASAMIERAEIMRYSLVVIASVPMLAIFPFVQKYFVKGMMIGAVKG